MIYKDKETGKIKELNKIKEEYNELLGNTNEFNEYKENFEQFLEDYYIEKRED